VPYYGGPALLPPWYFPPEPVFGPDRWIGPHIAPLPRVEPPEDAAGPEKAPPNQRGTNAESVARARRFIAIGDRMFAERKYADAYENYRQAGVAAPRLADACFRQGFALVACGHYESAARAFKRGLDLDAAWPQSDFRLDLLYRDHGVDKATHLDMLATAAIAKPHDADLLFLTGISLHFDGQANRARPFFQRAGQLSGADAQRGKTFELPEREAATDDGPF
jgi:tetratricopeptide (TPR) repeat protein